MDDTGLGSWGKGERTGGGGLELEREIQNLINPWPSSPTFLLTTPHTNPNTQQRALLEPCRVRYLRHARFAHEASQPLLLPQLQQQEQGQQGHQEEEAAAAIVVVVPTPALLVLQGQRRAAGRALPRVEVGMPAAPPPGANTSSSSSSGRKRPWPSLVAAVPPREPESSSGSSGSRGELAQQAAAVARHVVSGGLAPGLFEELLGMMAAPWDPAGRGEVVGPAEIEGAARGARVWVEANRGEVAKLSERRRWRRQRRRRQGEGGNGEMAEEEEEEEEGEEDEEDEWEMEVTTGDEEEEGESSDDDDEDGMLESEYETEDEEV